MSFLCGGCVNDEEEKGTQLSLVQESVKEASLSVEKQDEPVWKNLKEFPSDFFQIAFGKMSTELKGKLSAEQGDAISKKSKEWSKNAESFWRSVKSQTTESNKTFASNSICMIKYTNKSQYFGQVKEDSDKLEGIGVMFEVQEDGSVFVSAGMYMAKRKPSANSFIAWPHGDYFLGQSDFGRMLAGEFLSNTEKRLYKGNFDGKGRLFGKGSVEYFDGSERRYEGEFKEGKPQGEGTFYWKGGNTYTGMFENGKQHGFGQLFIKEKLKVFETHWVNGELQDD